MTLRGALLGLTGLALVTFAAPNARAEDAPAKAEPTERNSLPMMFTGIGISVLGFGAIGGGVAGLIVGGRDCDSHASRAVENINGSFVSPTDVYTTARQHCRDTSDAIAAGMAAVIGGSVLTAAGVAFTIAGAWKVPVKNAPPAPTASLRVTPSFVGLVGSF